MPFFLLCATFVAYLAYFIWYPASRVLISEFHRLWTKWCTEPPLFRVFLASFYIFFLVPCAGLTNERINVSLWLIGFLLLKNAVLLTQSVGFFLVLFYYCSLLFEHLLFGIVCHSLPSVDNFFKYWFGTELIHYCLGNMWKAPAKKIAGVALVGSYEVGITIGSEIAGSTAAKKVKAQFPNMTLQEYQATQSNTADEIYNRFSLTGNLGTFMVKLFGYEKKG